MATSKHVTIETADGVTVIGFDATLSNIQEESVSGISQELLGDSAPSFAEAILIDLSGVEFFGSSFIEILFRLWNRVKTANGRFALCGVGPFCLDVLRVTNLDTLWSIYPDRDTAVNALAVEHG